MAISLAISITRFHSRRVDVVKIGDEKAVCVCMCVYVSVYVQRVDVGKGEGQFLLSQL